MSLACMGVVLDQRHFSVQQLQPTRNNGAEEGSTVFDAYTKQAKSGDGGSCC